MMAHLLLYGSSYSQIIRIGKNSIVGLYPLLPDHMEVDRDSKGSLTYTYTTSNGKTVVIKPQDALYIPGLGFDGIISYSLIALEKNAIGLDLQRFFGFGGRNRFEPFKFA